MMTRISSLSFLGIVLGQKTLFIGSNLLQKWIQSRSHKQKSSIGILPFCNDDQNLFPVLVGDCLGADQIQTLPSVDP